MENKILTDKEIKKIIEVTGLSNVAISDSWILLDHPSQRFLMTAETFVFFPNGTFHFFSIYRHHIDDINQTVPDEYAKKLKKILSRFKQKKEK